MHHFYFDASALVKRYTRETGSEKINFLFDNIPLDRLMCSVLGAVEVFWVCVRKKNDKRIMVPDFAQAVVHLNREVIAEDSDFTAILTHKSLIWASMDLIETYSLNSVDSIVLRSALEVATLLRNAGDELVLVASDQRLLRAAQAEGILVFNPEIDSQEALEIWVFDTLERDDDC